MVKQLWLVLGIAACSFPRPAELPSDAGGDAARDAASDAAIDASIDAPIDAATATLSVNGTSYDFGTGVISMTTTPAVFRISNIGGLVSGTLSPAALGGTNPESFTIATDGCGGQLLDPQTHCDVSVSFSPTTVGMKQATLTIAATPGGTIVITLSGTGAQAGTLAISPAPYTFPDAVVAGQAAMQTFTVTNTGGTNTSPLATPTVTGDAAFAISSEDCSGKVLTPANGAMPACAIVVRFSPSAFGTRTATLAVSASVGGTQQTAITGTGQQTFTLTVTNPGGGRITSTPMGDIDCGSSCTKAYAVTTTPPSITLSPTANTSFTFDRWTGSCTGTAGCMVTMDRDRAVSAYFETNLSVTISTVNAGSGTVNAITPTGFFCSTGTCTAAYDYGTNITLRAAPASGTAFSGWSGACTNTTGDCIVPMTLARSVTATFSKICTPGTLSYSPRWVDPVMGVDDENHGGAGFGCANKTIGYALSRSGSEATLYLAPATYTLGANGEATSLTLTGRKMIQCDGATITWGTNGTSGSEYMVSLSGNGTAGNEIKDCVFDGKSRIGNAVRITTSGPGSSLPHWVTNCDFRSIGGTGITVLASLMYLSGSSNTFTNVTRGWYFHDQGSNTISFSSSQFSGTSTVDIQCATSSPNVQGTSNRRAGAQPTCSTCSRCGSF